jgi:tetratricopeptide (TPR) repeat protein
VRYSAFISYNHRDRGWAIWLHRALEGYSIPERLWGRPAPWGEIGKRLPPVFRDRDELATSSDLAESVREALAESAFLVVICSPHSAKSKWVDQEIRTFIEAGRERLIRLIIVDGEPHSADPERECLPPSLMREGAPEPLAADVRSEGDGKQAAKLKILAGILGVPYDELRQREAARRHKRLAAVALAASVGFFLMAGLALFAFVSRSEAIEQRKLAERRTMTAERTVQFVKSMFELADPSEARGESITAREIVDRGAAKLDSPTLDREPMVKAELGVTLADVYGALGLYRQGDALVRRTFTIRHGQPATFARQLNALGESQLRLGEYDAAAATFRKAWANSGSAGSALRSRILVGLGQTISNLEDYEGANRVLGKALAIDRARGGDAGNDVARDLEAIGHNHYYAGDLDRARPLIVQALALRRRFEGPDSPSVADNLNTLGEIAYVRHDLAAAENYFRGNLEVDRKVLGPEHPDLGTTMNNLARVLIERRRFAEAAPLLERAMAIGLRERGESHAYMTFVFSNLAIARRQMGRKGEAEALFEKAIAAARTNQHRTLGPSLADLAEVRCATGRAREGLALLGEAMRVTRADYPDKPWRAAWVDNVRGECLLRNGQAAEGKKAIASSSPVILENWPAGTLFAAEAQRRSRLALR